MTQPGLPGRSSYLVYLKLIAVAAIWGGTFIAARIVAQAMPPEMGAVGRFGIATLGFVAVAFALEGGLPRLTRAQTLGTLALGLTGIFMYNVGFFNALNVLPASRTSLLVSLNPIVTLIGAYLFLGERLSPVRLLGIALALIGVTIVITRGELASLSDGSFGPGEAFMMLAVVSWAAYTLIGRVVMRGLSVFAATTYAALWGTAFLSLNLIAHWQPIPVAALTTSTLAALVYLGLIGTVVAFTWYAQGVNAVGAARAAVFTNLVPVFAVIQAALILGEPILPSMVVGGAIAICGVLLANKPSGA
jgi:drug/metabolite transporter (DMT)-like permease